MPFDATDYTGLIAWWRPDTLGLSNGANVTSFTDASGNGLHLTPPGTAPTYDTDEFHGLGVVRYDGSSGQKLQLTDAALNVGEFTLFIVAHIDSWELSQHWLVNKDASNPASIGLLKSLNEAYKWLAGFRLDASPGTFRQVVSNRLAQPGVLVHELSYDGSTFTYRVNGRTVGTVSVSGAVDAAPSAPFVLGGHPDVGTHAFDGWFGDVVYYDNALSEANRDQAVADLLDKWTANRVTSEDASNPVLLASSIGITADEIRCPRMVLDGSTYYTLYAYRSGTGWDGVSYATSPSSDPFNFTPSGTQIIADDTGSVSAVKSGGTWYVFVDDFSAGTISLYTGADLDSLTLDTANIISGSGTPGADDEYVRFPSTPIEVGGTWYMLVDGRANSPDSGVGAIFLYSAAALDGTWSQVAEVLSPSGLDDWEQDDVGSPDWVLIDGTYWMVYSGFNTDIGGGASVYRHSIGLASSTDRVNWTKHAQNPVVWNEPAHYNEIMAFSGSFLDFGGLLHLVAMVADEPFPDGDIAHWNTTIAGTAPPPSKPTVFIDQVHDDSVDASTSVFIAGEGGSHTHSRWRIRDAVTQAIVYNPGDDASNLTSIDLAGSGIPLISDKNYEISVEHKEDDTTYSPPADWVPFKTSGGAAGGGGGPIPRSFRVIVYEKGEDIGGAIEFGLEDRHLVTPLEVGGQVARVLDGYAESLPYVVSFHDPDEDVAPLLFDANGRPAVLGRVVEVRLIEDGTEVTVDVRRLATVRMKDPPVVELELIDEAAFDRVLLFERNETIQVVGPGPVSEWAGVTAAVGVDAEVVDSSGDFRQIDADSGIIIVRGPQKTALEQDVIDSPSGSNTSGNFKALTARLGGVVCPITSFGALSADTAEDILDLDNWGPAGLSMPPFWVYWPGGPATSQNAGTLDMDFTGGGVPTTADLPYLLEEDDIRDLLSNAMGGGSLYGVQGSVAPMRFLLPSTTELPVDRIPQPVSIAVPGPVSRIDFVRQVARLAGLVLWMDNQGRIVPRPWEVPPIADLSQGELDALFRFDASTATSVATYEVMLSRAFNVWRAQGIGLFPRTVGVEDTPFIGLQLDAAEVEFDDAASSPIGPGRTVFDADFPGYLVGDGLVDSADSVGQLFVGQALGGQSEGRITGHAVSDAPMPGDLVLLDHDNLKGVNPATGTRAGLQLARVVDRRRSYTESEVFFEYRIIYGGEA